jgi:hypothetical protein
MTRKGKMIKVFLKLGLDFTREQVERFIDSIPKAIRFLYAIEEADKDKQSIVRDILMAKLMALNDSDQWPLLRKIADRKLELYEDIDEGTVTEFTSSIRDEMELKLPSNSASPQDKREYLRIRIKDRINLYRERFDLDKKEIDKLKKDGLELYQDEKNNKNPLRRTVKALTIMGVVTGGVAYGAYKLLKPKNGNNN